MRTSKTTVLAQRHGVYYDVICLALYLALRSWGIWVRPSSESTGISGCIASGGIKSGSITSGASHRGAPYREHGMGIAQWLSWAFWPGKAALVARGIMFGGFPASAALGVHASWFGGISHLAPWAFDLGETVPSHGEVLCGH